ncbi:MAG TPA: carboxypeptidase regulatory-like domain-containing protein [Gemmatimonadales bacterium]|nr:carboxypeptidase regulatory-like domain-containing protein [Gemmatimonadales bacterium]
MTAFDRQWLGGVLAVGGLFVLATGRAVAQTTTGTIRGYVRDSSGAPLEAAELQARNTQSGFLRTATSNDAGAYVLPALQPGVYDVTARHIGHSPQARRIEIQIGATQLVDFTLAAGAIEVAGLTVQATPPAIETRTSEVATNVTQQQINNLPTSNRNIFDLAALAPGIVTQNDQINSTRRTFAAGATGPQFGADEINVFIDGASYKNDLLRGGIVGQDRSRGNPFARSSIQEFRVITQNYKAEYQKATNGIIVATTKSGGNTWRGNAFFGFQDAGLVALDTFQLKAKAANSSFKKPDYTRYQLGLSIGGPLIVDRLHVFASYEGNYQNRTSLVNINTTTAANYPALNPVNLGQYNGNFGSPFRETLLFGKLSYEATPHSSFELSLDGRTNSDIRDFGALFNQPDHSFQFANRLMVDTYTGRLKHTYVHGPLVNEATVGFQRYRDQSIPDNPGTITQFFCCNFTAWIGSNFTIQDFKQYRTTLRNDLTYSGFNHGGQHVFKTGINIDFMKYDVVKRNSENPLFVWTDADSFNIPEHVEFQFGNPSYGDNNTEIGAYLQDDWSPTPKLTFNVGVRWDYESNMINTSYRTPQDVVDTLTKYASSLFLPLNPSRYFTDGTQRSAYKGAFQPRLGFSYQLDQAGKTTLFGGWGIFVDRTVHDLTAQEKEALQHPTYRINFKRFPGDSNNASLATWNPAYLGDSPAQILAALGPNANAREVKLLPNDLRPPLAQHFSFGVRQLLGSWGIQASYNGARTNHVFTFSWANIDFPCGNGSCFTFHGIPGFSNILMASTTGKAWYDALEVRVDRPYRRSSERFGWGAGLAYTFAKRQTQGFNDDFSFPNTTFYPKQVRNDERSHVVANWIVDMPYLFGVQFSGLLTLGTGTKQDVGDRFANVADTSQAGVIPEFGGFSPPKSSFILPSAWAFRNLDLRMRKDFPEISGTSISITVDLFNVFNYQNFGCFDTFNRRSATFGDASCTISDPRRLQIGGEYNF